MPKHGGIRESDGDVEEVRAEREHLLEELALAYQQMEQVLSSARLEREITYRELRSRNEELQRKLSELEAAHDQLREAQKMLVRGERLSAMGQMSAAVVHDLNGPLAVIAGHADLMLMREEDSSSREQLGAICQAVQRLRDLSANMLNLSDKSRTDVKAIDINELVEEVFKFLSPVTKAVNTRIDFASDLPALAADSAQLEQVLTNFVMNALDATEGKDDRQLEVSTGCKSVSSLISKEEATGRKAYLAIPIDRGALNREWVYAEVGDNGSGISGEKLTRIFEVFYTTKGESGTGLGLAISKKIVEEQRGTILVASREGGGTSFRLLLPVDSE